MGNKNLITAKKACKYLKLDSAFKVPICTIEPIICTYWFCKAKGFRTKNVKCNLNCFRNCAIKNPDATRIIDIDAFYNQTIVNLDERLDYYKNKMHPNQFYGGLVAYREHEILTAFYETPGAFSDVFEVINLIPEDISFLNKEDINIDVSSNYYIALNSMKNVYKMKLNQINNGDLIIYCTPKGRQDIEKTMSDPESDDFMKFAKHGSHPSTKFIEKSECHHIMEFITIQNYNLIKWCKSNQFKREILEFDHIEKFKKILTHIEQSGITGKIDLRDCYNLSYIPYMNAVCALRNIYSHSKKFLRAAKKYKSLMNISDQYIQWLPCWDNSLFVFSEMSRNEKYLTSKIDIEESSDFPIQISANTFIPSIIMWGFVAKNWDEICSNRWEKGHIFENKIEIELRNREVKILHKNLTISGQDEIDFICEKDEKYYIIEAKNYGPNWDYNYLSSLNYEKRMAELNSKLAYAPRRLELIENNRSRYNIHDKYKIYGIIITSYYEPDIEIPEGFICITINQFDKIFGKGKETPDWQKNPIFQVPEDIVKKLHAKYNQT